MAGLCALVLLLLVCRWFRLPVFPSPVRFNYDTGPAVLYVHAVESTANVTLRTYSYAGGTNAAGQVILSGASSRT